MRAVCEACDRPQPVGWQAGDLCVHCGAAVRRDLRCFWCAQWTPAARFCRHCGAETVDEALYGAARMLKDAGTDRFTVPKLLRELDPEQVENFTRIYQRQAAVVARLVDDLRLCEGELGRDGWSAAAEDELVPTLPWDAKRLAAMAPPGPPDADAAERLRAIHQGHPLPLARTLAALARLRRDEAEALSDARAALTHADAAVREAAALILAGWRAQTCFRLGDLDRELIAILRSLAGTPAAVRLAYLGARDAVLPSDALDHPDPDTAFTAALAAGDLPRLRAALAGDVLQRRAAGCALARRGAHDGLAPLLADADETVRDEVLHALAAAKAPAPALAEPLLAIVADDADAHRRERAARVLARDCPPGRAPLLAALARDDRAIWQGLLQSPAVPPEDLHAIGLILLRRGRFSMSQYGLADAAKPGRMPAGFVPAAWPEADDAARRELCRFAETQLGHRDDEELHRFLLHVVFGEETATVRAAAWWSLHRWYRHGGEHRGEGPLRLEPTAIRRFFPSLADFVRRLAAVLADHDTLKEVGLYDRLAGLLGYGDKAIGPELLACERETHALVRQLLRVMADDDYHPFLRSGAAKALLPIAAHPLWRDEVRRALPPLQATHPGMWELEKLAEALG